MSDSKSGNNNPYSPDHDPAFAAAVAGVGEGRTWEQVNWDATLLIAELMREIDRLRAELATLRGISRRARTERGGNE